MIWYLWWLILTEVVFVIGCILARDEMLDFATLLGMKVSSTIIGGAVLLIGIMINYARGDTPWGTIILQILEALGYIVLVVIGLIIFIAINYWIYEFISNYEFYRRIKNGKKKKK